jgi:hypothetical protein
VVLNDSLSLANGLVSICSVTWELTRSSRMGSKAPNGCSISCDLEKRSVPKLGTPCSVEPLSGGHGRS